MKAVQLDIFGNEVQPKAKKEPDWYVLHLYHKDTYCGTRQIKAYSEKQAIFLFYNEDETNKQYRVSDCYKSLIED